MCSALSGTMYDIEAMYQGIYVTSFCDTDFNFLGSLVLGTCLNPRRRVPRYSWGHLHLLTNHRFWFRVTFSLVCQARITLLSPVAKFAAGQVTRWVYLFNKIGRRTFRGLSTRDICASVNVFFLKIFVGPRPILWSHWLLLFWTSCVLPHGFQIQSGSRMHSFVNVSFNTNAENWYTLFVWVCFTINSTLNFGPVWTLMQTLNVNGLLHIQSYMNSEFNV